MDGTENELLCESEDENETENDSPESDWDHYCEETVNDDLYDELFSSDDDDSSNFLLCQMYEKYINTCKNVYLVI